MADGGQTAAGPQLSAAALKVVVEARKKFGTAMEDEVRSFIIMLC